ncbi:endonuclease/exonuclease/phosphatase family protein [Flavobacterium hiemivividum]|uniref:Endonuclease/exonuclease/phosphatase family protein n=1 Tax=Flavobacterium hiemivividum TaxID=2541734 RepID=A0A4R5D4B2_9FLAO|nr:endonuclease/exonuclease/phosphatase family protein [Flavobacterium hiemivividum]TDE06650.1 endonuclease/exonuclease/phosphatase family protein [Flavobacterium hiemivividum]
MRVAQLFLMLLLMLPIAQVLGQQKKYAIHTVAFYNFENLFDTINDPNTNDDEWTPKGAQKWTTKKYKQKLQNLSRVLLEIGSSENTNSPTFIGGCEIENRGVLEDLIKETNLIDRDYGIIHFESPDKRGIDVALLYQKKYFRPTTYTNIPLIVYKKESLNKVESDEKTDDSLAINYYNNRVFTRDQLLVTGFLDGEEINIIVNHWPSRSGGEKKSSPFREAAGVLNRKIIDSLQQINPNAKVLTMGDLNDGPYNKSIKVALDAKAIKGDVLPFGIYNPFEEMAKRGLGTIAYRDSWDIFDQIMVSQSLIRNDFSSFSYWKAGIYNKSFLIQSSGQYKGYPKRHSVNEVGFSDHFPVYIYLIKEVQ